jgi:ubiquinone/menaquinone biosynthesis C-methylase UbiE
MESSRFLKATVRRTLQLRHLGHVTKDSLQYAWMYGLRVDVSEKLGLASGDRVLDVGCGDGWFSLQNGLKYPEVQFTGIDLYETQDAKELSRLMGVKNCRFYRRDAMRMNISRSFDFVVLFMTLGNICETLPSVKLLFANCLRAMKKEAELLIVEPFQEDFPEDIRDKLRHMYSLYKASGKSHGEDHETVLGRDMALEALRDSDFRVLQVLGRRFGWYVKRDAVMEYFGLPSSFVDIPERFWVLDKPKQVTIILAKRLG